LLELEREEEVARFRADTLAATGEELEARGRALLDLAIKDEGGGLAGRTIVQFEPRKGDLPRTRLGPGDAVRLSRKDPGDPRNPLGVVLDRTRARISVAFDDELPPWAEEPPLRLDVAGDDVSFSRAREAVDEIESASGRVGELRKIFFGTRTPEIDVRRPELGFLDATLNASQRAAVLLGLRSRDLALIHGPPGTGKTTTVVELVRQAVRRGERVLATAPSNHATDNLVERFVAHGEKVVRLGHPARVSPALRGATLDALVEATSERALARQLLEDAFALKRKLSRRRERGKVFSDEEREERAEMARLFRDARRQDEVALRGVLEGARIVCATAAGAGHEHLRGSRFDLVILDEASQATVPLALVPIVRGARCVLAGDHRQLPPTVLSQAAAKDGLSSTLFERMIERHPGAGTLLEVQYRMHAAIMRFPSERLYDGKLVAHGSVAAHLLRDLPGIDASREDAGAPLAFFDTSGMGLDEELQEGSTSSRNPGEAALVASRVRSLLGLGLDPRELAVIAPYDAQAKLLRELISEEAVEVDTVDGFQGREKEAVIVSLTRSNERGEVGFLADIRRMNVALTRARRRLEVVGDGATIANHPFYAAFVESMQASGAWRSGFEIEGPS
ncbi:IGHMBP2 family helicase, partial [bacterium]|nr:IGHMBP2 family helicase [bacterium]